MAAQHGDDGPGARLLRAIVTRLERFDTDHDPAPLLAEEAVRDARRLVAAAAPGPAAQFDVGLLTAAGWLFWYRAGILANHGDQDTATAEFGLATGLFRITHRFHPGMVLPEPLRESLAAPPAEGGPGPITDPVLAQVLGALITAEAQAARDPDLLEQGLSWLRAALEASWDQEQRADLQLLVAAAVIERYQADNDPERLREGLALVTEALATSPADYEHRADAHGLRITALATGLGNGVDLGGWPVLAEAAERARAELPPDHPGRAAVEQLMELAAPLRPTPARGPAEVNAALAQAALAEFGESGDLAERDRAVELLRRALADPPADPGTHGHLLVRLATLLASRNRDETDHTEPAELVRAADELLPADHPARAELLAARMVIQFSNSGFAIGDDADSARLLWEVVTADPASSGDRRAALLAALVKVMALGMRVWNRDDPDVRRAADAAVREAATAVGELPADALEQLSASLDPTALLGLVDFLVSLGRRPLAADQLDRLRANVAAQPEGSVPRAQALVLLGQALLLPAVRTNDPAGAREARGCFDEVLRCVPAGHHLRVTALHGKAQLAGLRAQRTSDPDLWRAAIGYTEDALAEEPPDSPRARTLRSALNFQRTQLRSSADSPGPDTELIDTAHDPAMPIGLRLRAAMMLGQAASNPDTAVAAAETAVALLRLLAERGQTRAAAELGLAGFDHVVRTCAVWVMRANQPERALALLEAGRGVLLGQQLDARTDLTELRSRDAGLAERFVRVTRLLEGSTDDLAATMPVGALDRDDPELSRVAWVRTVRRGLADEFERVVAEIRAVPGFARFCLPPNEAELLAQASAGPIAVLNWTPGASGALLVRPDGVRALSFDHVVTERLPAVAERFAAALDVLAAPGPVEPKIAANDAVRDTLGWLWDHVAEPVLAELGRTDPVATGADWPRLWWTPTGPFSALPLHAAGRDGASVLDRVVSSYTPTIRALAASRAHPVPDDADEPPELLVVAMPRTPGDLAPLPNAAEEARLVGELTGGRGHLLRDERADFDGVLARLPAARWAHFACHAHTAPDDPSSGRLLLHDHARRPLTVLDVSRARLPHAELAFLSACGTARTGQRLADESIHLTSAFQLAGFRHVVGTLWQVADAEALAVARDFYAGVTHGGRASADRAALALHHATRASRARNPRLPHRWAAHIHVGG